MSRGPNAAKQIILILRDFWELRDESLKTDDLHVTQSNQRYWLSMSQRYSCWLTGSCEGLWKGGGLRGHVTDLLILYYNEILHTEILFGKTKRIQVRKVNWKLS